MILIDDLLNIDNPYFAQMVGQIYPTECQLNKANPSDTGAPFFDLDLSITNGIDSTKIYDKRDDFNFEMLILHFLMEMFLAPLPMVYLFRNLFVLQKCVLMLMALTIETHFLISKLLKQGYRYHKLHKAFSKFYYQHSELIVKYNICSKIFLQQGISEPVFCGDLVYKFKRIVGETNFSDQFKKIIKRYKIVSEYDQEVPQSQTADNPEAPRGRAAQPSRDTRKTN